jgi:hypothetical protein
LSGSVPWVGAVLSEIVSSLIPNQKLDRLSAFATLLGRRLEGLEEDFRTQLVDDENVLFFEDVLIEAARAVTEERRERLAALVCNGVREKSFEPSYKRRLLQIVGQVNDMELLILDGYNPKPGQGWRPSPRGPDSRDSSSQALKDMRAVHDSFEPHLLDLGLLSRRFERPGLSGRKEPEIDLKTGMARSTGLQITDLGSALMRFVTSRDGAA